MDDRIGPKLVRASAVGLLFIMVASARDAVTKKHAPCVPVSARGWTADSKRERSR